ncbi:MAG: amidohydrolase [Verrucomicrobia bacterium]|nr:amidohydrolase [Verrucomicrobiota bacterium]
MHLANSLIDFHVHIFPAEASANPDAWAAANGEPHWHKLVTSGPQGWADVDALLLAMDMVGIEHAVLQGWYWQQIATCEEHNRCMARWVAKHPQRLSFFATTVPGDPQAVDVLYRAREIGAMGAGELFPPVSGCSLDAPAWDELLFQLEEWDWPVLLHTAEPAGHFYPGRIEVPLQSYVDMALRHPGLRFVLAHWGGGLPFYHLNPKLCASLPNVYYDTAASPLLFKPAIWSVALDCVDADRILFGSDFPLKIYPRFEPAICLRRLIDEALEHLPASASQRILSLNAKKLLSL